jgi:hypothetical protein
MTGLATSQSCARVRECLRVKGLPKTVIHGPFTQEWEIDMMANGWLCSLWSRTAQITPRAVAVVTLEGDGRDVETRKNAEKVVKWSRNRCVCSGGWQGGRRMAGVLYVT